MTVLILTIGFILFTAFATLALVSANHDKHVATAVSLVLAIATIVGMFSCFQKADYNEFIAQGNTTRPDATPSLTKQYEETRKLYEQMNRNLDKTAETDTQISAAQQFTSFKDHTIISSLFYSFSTKDLLKDLKLARAIFYSKLSNPNVKVSQKLVDLKTEQWLKEKENELKQMLDSWNNTSKPESALLKGIAK